MSTKNVGAEIVNFAMKCRHDACTLETKVEATDPCKERVQLDLSVVSSIPAR